MKNIWVKCLYKKSLQEELDEKFVQEEFLG